MTLLSRLQISTTQHRTPLQLVRNLAKHYDHNKDGNPIQNMRDVFAAWSSKRSLSPELTNTTDVESIFLHDESDLDSSAGNSPSISPVNRPSFPHAPSPVSETFSSSRFLLAQELGTYTDAVGAEEAFRAMASAHLNGADAWISVGQMLELSSKRHTAAKRAYIEALYLDDTKYTAWSGLARILQYTEEDFTAASYAYYRSVTIEPEQPVIWMKFGDLLQNGMQDMTCAMEAYGMATVFAPDCADAWAKFGFTLEMLGKVCLTTHSDFRFRTLIIPAGLCLLLVR